MCPDLSKQKTTLVKAHLRNHLGKRLFFKLYKNFIESLEVFKMKSWLFLIVD